jgi:hypothetical protein
MRSADCGMGNTINYQMLEPIAIGRVATVTLNHPEVFDAFSGAILQSGICNPQFSSP